MKKFVFAVSALALSLATASAAKADSFNFSVSGVGFTGSGTLSGNSLGGDLTAITSGAVTVNGVNGAIVGNWTDSGFDVYAAGAGYQYDYDNILIGAGASKSLDDYGLLFLLSNGAVVNIWEVGGIDYWNEWTGSDWLFNPGTGAGGEEILTNITPTPEPSSLFLLGTGLLLMASFVYLMPTRNRTEQDVQIAA